MYVGILLQVKVVIFVDVLARSTFLISKFSEACSIETLKMLGSGGLTLIF
jgi:hypothetical protein